MIYLYIYLNKYTYNLKALAKNFVDKKWRYFDDSNVNIIDNPNQFLSNKDRHSYILVYTLKPNSYICIRPIIETNNINVDDPIFNSISDDVNMHSITSNSESLLQNTSLQLSPYEIDENLMPNLFSMAKITSENDNSSVSMDMISSEKDDSSMEIISSENKAG